MEVKDPSVKKVDEQTLDAHEIQSGIESAIQTSIDANKPFARDQIPTVTNYELVPVLETLLKKFAQKDDADRFLILFHAFKKELDTEKLKWGTEILGSGHATMNVGISRAIKELWDDKKINDGDLLMKVALKVGVLKPDDIARIRDMVGVSESTGRDRL